MFALLEHTTPDGTHWDLLVEVQGQAALATWRLGANPAAAPGDVPAERIHDHRRLYLDYEGEISGGRGRVRRLDRGPAEVAFGADATASLVLKGALLRGRYQIACGGRVFRRVAFDGGGGAGGTDR